MTTRTSVLRFHVVRIHEKAFHALFHYEATPNAMSQGGLMKLLLSTEEASSIVTVTSVAQSGAVGRLMVILALCEKMRAEMIFIVVKHTSFEIIIGHSIIKRLENKLYFHAKVVCFNYKGQEAVLPMTPEYMHAGYVIGSTDCADFTFESEQNGSRKENTHDWTKN